ncbi:hypothetical protein GQ53DRAFT_754089 [Thozetella sp. PMI_491]|nr:hypothetical protein GQ53DRAFT_754089 [Thozetella sp. PMI_491]
MTLERRAKARGPQATRPREAHRPKEPSKRFGQVLPGVRKSASICRKRKKEGAHPSPLACPALRPQPEIVAGVSPNNVRSTLRKL